MAGRALTELYARFLTRTNQLVQTFGSPVPPAPPFRESCLQLHVYGRLNLVVRLQVLWAEFCRELVERSALGGCRSLGGKVLPRAPGVSGLSDIRKIALAESGRRPPPWHLTWFAVRVARRVGVQNLVEIRNGLSAVSAVDDLVAVRNYVVHPNEKTRVEYARVARRANCAGAAPQGLLATYQTGGATLFEAWVADLQTMALNAIR